MSGTRVTGRGRARSEKTGGAPRRPPERRGRAREAQALMLYMDQQAAEYRQMAFRLDALLRARKLRRRAAWAAGTVGERDQRRLPHPRS